SRADDGGLRDWRVDDTLRTEAVDKAIRDFKRAAVDADVLAEAEDGGVTFHFLPYSLADGFEISESGHGRISLQMYCCFCEFWSSGTLLGFRDCILRLDVMAAIFTIDASRRGFRFGHRRSHSEVTVGFELLINISDQFSVLSRTQQFLLQQIILKPGDGIALAPVVEQKLGKVIGSVVDGAAFHTHYFGVDERGTLAEARAFTSFVGGVVNLAGIGAIHDHARDAVSDSALSEIFHLKLHVGGHGVCPKIVFNEEHQAEALHGSKVDALISN